MWGGRCEGVSLEGWSDKCRSNSGRQLLLGRIRDWKWIEQRRRRDAEGYREIIDKYGLRGTTDRHPIDSSYL